MTISRRPSPFGELLSLRQAMDRLLEDSFVRPRGAWGVGSGSMGAGEGSPLALDVSTTKDALVIEAALPGVRPDDVEITVEDGTLTIRGQSSSEKEDRQGDYVVQEIRRGEFSRSLTLPNGLEADKAEATFEDGILTLRIPRAEQVKPRQIRISPTSTSNGTQATDTSDSTRSQGNAGSASSSERA